MGFIVKTVGGSVTLTEQQPGDWYEFLEGGVLAVHYADEAKWSEYYPPHRWEQITADQPPGRPVDPEAWANSIY
ncbi:hypothetical protein [Mycolicibacterium obuense]|uniref:Uncharacterized protein n=1 Tax=Mycolicibacterium obuense TaxID=1807 RepID=A0A0M2JSC5_9MYCO|nr:hypothetical protein [Mycolicibacterium obuense]KKE99470.1 hypothetical protein WN67_23830 [Mycolicibacterium obuense]